MGKKKVARKNSPMKEKAVEASHAEQPPAPPRIEEARPTVVPSTPSVQTPAVGIPQPFIPLDLVEKLLASISPDFNLTHTLARMAAENTNPILVQPPTIPTPQPIPELPEPSTKPTETPPEEEVEPKPKTPTSPLPEKPLEPEPKISPSPSQSSSKTELPTPDLPADSPTRTHTKTTTEPITEEPEPMKEDLPAGSIGGTGGAEGGVRKDEEIEAGDEGSKDEEMVEGEQTVEAEELLADREREGKTKAEEDSAMIEGVLEDLTKKESGDKKSVSEGKQSGDNEGTKEVSEERTEILESGDKKNVEEQPSLEEEVDHETHDKEREVVMLEDDNTIVGDEHEEAVDQRTRRRRKRVARRIAEILTDRKDGKRESEPSQAEDGEEEEIPLPKRPRSARVAVTEEIPIQTAKENCTVPVDEAKDAKEEPIDEEKYEKERKMKGKMIERPTRKKLRQATRNVVIQEPIQVPYKQAEEKSDKEMEEEEEHIADARKEEPQTIHYRKVFVKVDRYLLKRMEKFKDRKLQEEFKKKVTEGKKLKSGKLIHLPSLQHLAADKKFMAYIKSIGFEWLLENDMPEVTVVLAKEFFTSFRFKNTSDLDEVSISF